MTTTIWRTRPSCAAPSGSRTTRAASGLRVVPDRGSTTDPVGDGREPPHHRRELAWPHHEQSRDGGGDDRLRMRPGRAEHASLPQRVSFSELRRRPAVPPELCAAGYDHAELSGMIAFLGQGCAGRHFHLVCPACDLPASSPRHVGEERNRPEGVLIHRRSLGRGAQGSTAKARDPRHSFATGGAWVPVLPRTEGDVLASCAHRLTAQALLRGGRRASGSRSSWRFAGTRWVRGRTWRGTRG
jgi:hypothetical protein